MNGDIIVKFLESASIVIASCVTIYGINSWRRETKWKRRNELAEDVLFNLYDTKERLRIIRLPVTFQNEGDSRQAHQNEKENEKSIRNYAYVPVERYNDNKEPFLNIQKLKHRYKIYFGEANTTSLVEILSIKDEVLSASNKYARYSIRRDLLIGRQLNDSHVAEEIQRLNKLIELNAGIIWENYDEVDTITTRVDEVIRNQELILKKYFK